MESCATCSRALVLPPTINHLLSTFPTITPLYAINRRIPRCRHCDHLSAYRNIIDAELPPPEYRNPVRKMEDNIKRAYELIEEGVQAERLQATLPRMWQALRQTIREREEKIKRACEWFWGIWGKVELLTHCL